MSIQGKLLIFLLLIFAGYFALKKLIKYFIEKSSQGKIKLGYQTGLLSFSTLELNLPEIRIFIEEFSFATNILALFYPGSILFKVELQNLDIEILELPRTISQNGHTTKSDIKKRNNTKILLQQAVIRILFSFLSGVLVRINKINIKFAQENLHLSSNGISLKYTFFSNCSLLFQIIQDTIINAGKFGTFTLKPISFTLSLDPLALNLLTSTIPQILISHLNLNCLQVITKKQSITLESIDLNFEFCSYSSSLVTKSFTVQFEKSYVIPEVCFSLHDFSMDLFYPTIPIQYSDFTHLVASLGTINLKCFTEDLILIKDIHFILKDICNLSYSNCNYSASIKTIHLGYHTEDGLEIFPIVKQFRGPYTPTRIKFQFPPGIINITQIDGLLSLTDNASIALKAQNAVYQNQQLLLPMAYGYLNDHQLIKIKEFTVSSPDKEWLSFGAKKISIHQKNEVPINQFLLETIFAYKLIKPYVSSNQYDSETIPFPIKIDIDSIVFKIHDSYVHSQICAYSQNLSPVLQNNAVLQHIFNSKIDYLDLNQKQLDSANRKLQALLFKNFREGFKQMTFHKYLFNFCIRGVHGKLDSRDFIHKDVMLGQFDPPTAEVYPNSKWETLEGFKLEATFDSIDVYAIDIKNPIISVNGLNLTTPLVIAEIDHPDLAQIPFSVNGKYYNGVKTITDVKLYCDCKLGIKNFDIYFSGGMNLIFDDLADAFDPIIPVTLDPSPPLKWWDKIRSIFRGKYDLVLQSANIYILASLDPHDLDDNLTIIIKKLNTKFTEGNIHFKIDKLDGYRHISSKLKSNSIESSESFADQITDQISGPHIIHFEKLETDANIKWLSKEGDPRKHLPTPDINRFGEPDYDTYEPWRATGMEIDLDIDFRPGSLSPFLAMDLAHCQWSLKPIWLFFDTPLLMNSLQNKWGRYIKNRPKLFFLGDLNATFRYRINTQSLTFRIFDHYPVDHGKINGSSIAVTLCNFLLTFMHHSETKESPMEYDGSFEAESVLVTAPDLPLYTKFANLSTSIISFNDISARISTNYSLRVGSASVYINQFFARYLNEYILSTNQLLLNSTLQSQTKSKENFEEAKFFSNGFSDDEDDQSMSYSYHNHSFSTSNFSMSNGFDIKNTSLKIPPNLNNGKAANDLLQHLMRRRSSQRLVTVDMGIQGQKNKVEENPMKSFKKVFAELMIPKIEVVFESLKYDSRLLVSIEDVKGNILLNNDDPDKYGAKLGINAISLFNSGFSSQTNPTGGPIITVLDFSSSFWQDDEGTYINGAIHGILSNLTGNHIATIKQLVSELIPPKSEEVQKRLSERKNNGGKLKAELKINAIQGLLINKDGLPVGKIDINGNEAIFEMIGGNWNISFCVDDIEIDDMRNIEGKPVLYAWNDQRNPSMKIPYFRAQAKIPPPVGGITVFNQVELNLEPTICDYESIFMNQITEIIVAEMTAPNFEKARCSIKMPFDIKLGNEKIQSYMLPSLAKEDKDILLMFKSKEYTVMLGRADVNFLLRYFRVTQCRMDVSYHNPENMAIPDINEFNGFLHDIIYQDLTTTIGGLVSKLISSIAGDMIPQFLKHVVGLGKLPEKEHDIKNLLSNHDNEKTSQDKKKQLLFGQKSKK